MNLSNLQFHEIANEFPLLSESESDKLAEDIKKNGGLLEPLVLYEEQILDGRNRFIAAQKAGYKLGADDVIRFEEQYEGEDPVLFVISKNIARRHLTQGQRSSLAAELFKRMEKQKTRPKTTSYSIEEEVVPNRDERLSEAASVVGVSPKSVERAVGVLNADPELHEEVKAGKMTLHAATETVRQKKKASLMDKDEAQQRILEICGEKFWSAMTSKRMAGLKTGAERVVLADRPNAELKLLSALMFWGELTVTEALEFKKKRFGKTVSKEWRLQDLMAQMGMEAEYKETFVTDDREFAYEVLIRRFTPKARAKS